MRRFDPVPTVRVAVRAAATPTALPTFRIAAHTTTTPRILVPRRIRAALQALIEGSEAAIIEGAAPIGKAATASRT